jgi:hypothetical protein
MKRTFTYEFEDDGHNRITYEYSPEEDERLEVLIQDGQCFVAANRSGLLTLARILIKMAYGNYDSGFHVHLRKDFDGEKEEILVPVLLDDKA